MSQSNETYLEKFEMSLDLVSKFFLSNGSKSSLLVIAFSFQNFTIGSQNIWTETRKINPIHLLYQGRSWKLVKVYLLIEAPS